MALERTLAKMYLLKDIPELQIRILNDRCRWRNFEQEELILNLNDKSTDVYFIVQGEVRVTVFSESGRRANILVNMQRLMASLDLQLLLP